MDHFSLHNKLARMPMLKALIPLAAGIMLAAGYSIPAWLVWSVFILCGGLALVSRSSLYTFAAILFFGWGLAELRSLPADPLPRDVATEFLISIADEGGGTLTAWRDPERGTWRSADVQVVVHADSMLRPAAGERLLFRGYLNDFPPNSYGTLMRHRGYAGRVWISPKWVLNRKPPAHGSLHEIAVRRLARLGLTGKEQALCAAMTVGSRSALTAEMRQAYARSGTSHLLAVSGLHVGIVFLLVNVLLWWMPLLRRGHLLRNVAAIALIWLYALTTGLSPSVVRAALMFSALQLSLASASTYVSGNVLAATAFVMLLFRPSYLFDISFQLSFIAVAGILAWGVPLCRVLHCKYRIVNLLADTLVVGVVAAAATAPLTAHTFGSVSLVGMVVNPLVIPLACIVVLGAVVWILLPLTALAPLFQCIVGGAAAALNAVAEWAAALPAGAFEPELPAWAAAAVYCVMVVGTLAAWSRKPKKTVSLLR